jgi:hypothetical protein
MQIQHYLHEVRNTQERQEKFLMSFASILFPGQSSVGPIVTLGSVTLIDATNRSHTIPMDVCDSFEVSLAIRSILGTLTHPILCSDSMSNSSFYSNATRSKLKYRGSIWSKDSTICALMMTSK